MILILEKFIKKYNKKKFVVAYSGGLDSTVLLYLLIKYKKIYSNLYIRAIHINHHLNKLSNNWSLHCKYQCNLWNIDLTIKDIFLKNIKKEIESTARFYRYNFFKKNLKNNEILLTGHHIEDLSETFLLFLKRGCGPKGLTSIKFKRKINNIIVISPMLYSNKYTIKEIAIKNNLKWIEDPSNNYINFDRNFIRIKILPILRLKWPFIDKLIARTSYLCDIQNKTLNILIKPYIKNITKNNILFIKPYLLIYNKYIKYIILRNWIIKIIKHIPNLIYILDIYNNIILNKNYIIPYYKFKNNFLIKYKYNLYIINEKNINQNNKLKKIILIWNNINYVLRIPYNNGIIYKNKNGLLIRKPYKNEKIIIKFFTNKKIKLNNKEYKINNLYKNLKILPWKRYSIPLLFYNEKLIAVLNFFVTLEGISYNNKSFFIKWLTNDILQYN